MTGSRCAGSSSTARPGFRVSALDGSGARTVDVQTGRTADPRRTEFGWAFDGARVAWVAQPCALTTIQVWDLSSGPPPPVSETCGATALPTGRLALGPADARCASA